MEAVEQYYDARPQGEGERLERHRMEHAVTSRVIEQHLPAPPAGVLDLGGGPGRYAIGLARRGYCVTLADLSAGCLDVARRRAAVEDVALAGCIKLDARDLGRFRDGSFDAVLLLGPLYHLRDESDRRRAVREALRVVAPGGVLFAAFVTRFAVIRYAAAEHPEYVIEYGRDMLELGYEPDPPPGSFPGYFAHPGEIRPLMEECGLRTLDLVGCEGVLSYLEDRVNDLEGEHWRAWVELTCRLGREPSLYGAADHLLYVGRRP